MTGPRVSVKSRLPDTSGILKKMVVFLQNNFPLPGPPVTTFVQHFLLQRFDDMDGNSSEKLTFRANPFLTRAG